MNNHPNSLVAKSLAAITFTALTFTVGTITSAQLGTLPAALAQSTPDNGAGAPSHGRHGRMGAILKSLNLSPDQTAKVKEIVAQTRKQNENADSQTKRTNMKAAWENIRNNVLNPDQQKKFDAAMQSMHSENGQH